MSTVEELKKLFPSPEAGYTYHGGMLPPTYTGNPTPNVNLKNGYAVADQGGVFQGMMSLPKPSSQVAAPTPSPSQYGIPPVDIGAILSRLQAMQGQPLPDVRSTPEYTAAQTRLEEQGQRQGSQVVQRMAAMGRLKSGRTDEALKKIARDIAERLEVQVAPQIQQNLMQQRQSGIGNILNELQAAMSMQQFGANQQAADWARQLQAQQFTAGQEADAIKRAMEMAKAQEQMRQFDLNFGQKEADRDLRERLGLGNLDLGYDNLAARQAQIDLARDRPAFDIERSNKPPDYINKATQIMRGNPAYEQAGTAEKQRILKETADMLKALYENPDAIATQTSPDKQNILQRILGWFSSQPASEGELSDDEIRKRLGY